MWARLRIGGGDQAEGQGGRRVMAADARGQGFPKARSVKKREDIPRAHRLACSTAPPANKRKVPPPFFPLLAQDRPFLSIKRIDARARVRERDPFEFCLVWNTPLMGAGHPL